MSLESRSHMVSFRLTETEYDRFRELCQLYGIRSLSEMARCAMNMLCNEVPDPARQVVESRIRELENRVQMIAVEVKRLSNLCLGK